MKPRDRLKPIEATRIYHRRLPHIEEPGSTYFVTFRTVGDTALTDVAKNITFEGIKFHAGSRYGLHGFVVMETHVHLIIRPMQESGARYYSIAQILHSIKSYSAHEINKLSNTTGNIWLDESYDRIIRDEAEFREKMDYILNNPVKAGIVQKPEDYRWLFWNTDSDSASL